jgi:hypothetical protein
MRSKEEIEQLAESYLQKNKYNFDNWKEIEHVKKTYIDTYTQCQEDMADYIFKVAKEFHRLGKYSGNTSDTHFTDIYKETINSLNKQD